MKLQVKRSRVRCLRDWVRKVIKVYGLKLNDRISQVFMIDCETLSLMVKLANINPGQDVVLEIGGGIGNLSMFILHCNPKNLKIIEVDESLTLVLRQLFHHLNNVSILNADFLSLKPQKCDVIVANPPYHVASHIVLKLIEYKFRRAVLTFQYEFARRLTAKAGKKEYGSLSVLAQIHFNIKSDRRVNKASFYPPPKVDSKIIVFEPKKISDQKHTTLLHDLLPLLFAERRRKLKNAMRTALRILKYKRKHIQKVAQLLDDMGFSDLRPDCLTPEDYVILSKEVVAEVENQV
ncbi:MAG TPA: ribosomal RNA small subunit methyltransferase A [Candidatus Bathyarchaeota archaeon]|nr:ribosomal RNA small subunit methyltransferase A [Candidatus Bathyarchaeota archaeon]